MREIKFRLWDDGSKDFIYQHAAMFLRLDGMFVNYQKLEKPSNGIDKPYSLPKHLVLLQYIGCKDKNGRELYEGDIINVIESSLYHSRVEVSFTGVVRYDTSQSSFLAFNQVGKCTNFCGQEVGFEIIGNVFENPELLK